MFDNYLDDLHTHLSQLDRASLNQEYERFLNQKNEGQSYIDYAQHHNNQIFPLIEQEETHLEALFNQYDYNKSTVRKK